MDSTTRALIVLLLVVSVQSQSVLFDFLDDVDYNSLGCDTSDGSCSCEAGSQRNTVIGWCENGPGFPFIVCTNGILGAPAVTPLLPMDGSVQFELTYSDGRLDDDIDLFELMFQASLIDTNGQLLDSSSVVLPDNPAPVTGILNSGGRSARLQFRANCINLENLTLTTVSTGSSSGSGGGGGSTAIVAGAAAGGLVLIALLLLLIFRKKSSQAVANKPDFLHNDNPLFNNNQGHVSVNLSYDQVRQKSKRGEQMYEDPDQYEDPEELMAMVRELVTEVPGQSVQMVKVIGQGEFGQVCHARWVKDNLGVLDCAAKTVHDTATASDRREFLKEAAVMGQFQHDNVVALFGVVLDSSPQMIITELMTNGSLDSYLTSHKLELAEQTRISRDIAKGMAYLSGKGFIHRDLAARNILLSHDMVAKVADFGLSKEVDDDSDYFVSEGGKIPIRWTSPEAIDRKKYTSASDVWSYGITIWEVMSKGRRPYPKFTNIDVIKKVEAGYRLPCPKDCPLLLHELMLDCWRHQWRDRPSFDQIVERLTSLWQQYSGEGPYSIVGKAPSSGQLAALVSPNVPVMSSSMPEASNYDNAGASMAPVYDNANPTPYVASEA